MCAQLPCVRVSRLAVGGTNARPIPPSRPDRRDPSVRLIAFDLRGGVGCPAPAKRHWNPSERSLHAGVKNACTPYKVFSAPSLRGPAAGSSSAVVRAPIGGGFVLGRELRRQLPQPGHVDPPRAHDVGGECQDSCRLPVVSVNAFEGVDPSLVRRSSSSFDGEGAESRSREGTATGSPASSSSNAAADRRALPRR